MLGSVSECVCDHVSSCVLSRGNSCMCLCVWSQAPLYCEEETQAGLDSLCLAEPPFIFTQEQKLQLCWGFASQCWQSHCSQINSITGYPYHLLCSLTENLHSLDNFCDTLHEKKQQISLTDNICTQAAVGTGVLWYFYFWQYRLHTDEKGHLYSK